MWNPLGAKLAALTLVTNKQILTGRVGQKREAYLLHVPYGFSNTKYKPIRKQFFS